MASTELTEPKIVYIANMTGKALQSARAIAEDVAGNIANEIRWHDGTTVLEELGCRTFLEMPPGHALSDLARDSFKKVRSIAITKTLLAYAARVQ